MTWSSRIRAFLRSVFRREKFEREMQAELRFHIESYADDLARQGMSREQALRRARVEFGAMESQKEDCRASLGLRLWDELRADVRYTFRTLRKTPMLALVIVASLALGIGANTSIFSVMNAAMIRSLPVPEPDRLMLFTWTAHGKPNHYVEDLEGSGRRINGVFWSYSFPSFVYEYLKTHNRSFDNVVAFAGNSEHANIGLNGRADDALVQPVSGDFFNGLRVTPSLGRGLSLSDDAEDAPMAAMVSYNFWRSRMAGDLAAAGKEITVNGQPATVIGVLPPEFYGLEPGTPPDLYVPLRFMIAEYKRTDGFDLRGQKVWWLGIVGRAKPGVTEAASRAELKVLIDQALNVGSPGHARDAGVPDPDVTNISRGLDQLRRQYSTPLFLLMGMVGLVLLIACANVAGLLLARATTRQREIAVRMSLGAARGRVLRQLLTESVSLAALGGVGGLLLARWATQGLLAIFATGRHPMDLPVHLDWRVLLFTAGISVFCGVLFGLAPAFRATRVDVFSTLKQSTGQVAHGGTRFMPGKVLVAGQVAICLLLLVGAGLLLRTLRRLQNVQLGFDQNQLVTFAVQPGLNGYKGERLISYYQEFERRLQRTPGVMSVAISQLGPIGSGSSAGGYEIPGYTEAGKPANVYRHVVDANYFATLRIPVLLGRGISEQDTAAAPIAIVINQRAVQELFHGDNVLGRTLETGNAAKKTVMTIVGVVGDVKYNQIRDDAPPTLYISFMQRPQAITTMTFAVRVAGDPRPVMTAIHREALAVDKDVPVLNLRTERDVIDGVLMMERVFALLSSTFSGLALLLACVGLYGTIGYTVARRTNEIGIRIALGADRATILSMVLRETVAIVVIGMIVGLPLSWFATNMLKAQLFDLSPHDPLTIAAATAAILGVTLLAGLLPALRAARVDPMVALRYE